ncbi:MAG: ATP-grasp domain-containing protein [Bdellovibrionaceae bacterium]|nr:ATP-grasp domain-containing protein [Pseudobdellovibrionaceae bacterium]
MLVLLLGHRQGISKVLTEMNIPFLVWSIKRIKSPLKALKIIEAPFPKTKEELKKALESQAPITHVIAGTEEAVIPATKARLWLEARRNPLSLIIRCTDKLKMKEFLQDKNINMTEYMSASTELNPAHILDRLGKPLVAKPRKSSGGRGLKFIRCESEIDTVKSKDFIFEKAIHGSEGSVESFISNGKIQFTNITEYLQIGHCNLVPGHYESEFKNQVLELNKKVIEALNIQWGMTHLEFYKTPKKILFGEIAIRPPGGYIMEAMKLAYDVNFWELFVKIELNINAFPKINFVNYAASMVIHPPPGRVVEISGIKEVEALSSLKKLKLKLKVNQEVFQRLGVGQDHGYALFSHPEKVQLQNDLYAFQEILKIKMN